jgi:hypothetical protein
MMTPALRRLTLTTHIATSAGWSGAVLVFLALAVIGLTSEDERIVRGAYLTMAPAAWFVLVPLAHASLLSGIALALGTAWGLLRHYWVAVKLLLTVFATVILLIYMETFRQMAAVAADPIVNLADVRNASPVVHSVLALVVLLTTTVLSVYKPWGLTPYGVSARVRGEDVGAVVTAGGASAIGRAVNRRIGWIVASLILFLGILLLVGFLHSTVGPLHH